MIVLLVLIFSVIIALGVYANLRNNKNFKSKNFYFVCAMKSKKIKDVEAIQENVKKLGGAGKIYFKNNFYYLILNVYFDAESAKQVVDSNKNIYQDGLFFELKTEKIENSVKRQIKENDILKVAYLFMFQNIIDVANFSGKVSENVFCSEVLKIKFELEKLKTELEKCGVDEVCKGFYSFIDLMIIYYSNFLGDYFESDKKSSFICQFLVDLVFVYVDFINNL